MMKRTVTGIILLCLSLILSAGCGKDNGKVFREKILPDMERVFAGNDEVFAAYNEAVSAAEEYVQNPTEQNGEILRTAAKTSDETAWRYADIKPQLGSEEYESFEKLHIVKAEYDYLFNMQSTNMADLACWEGIASLAQSGDDTEVFSHAVRLQKSRLEIEKVYLVYGAMDFAAGMDRQNAEYVREMVYKYPNIIPENCVWLTEHDKINDEIEARFDGIELDFIREQEYINQKINALRRKQNN